MLKRMADRARPFQTTRIIVIGFALMILAGTLMLMLPVSSANGRSVGFPDAMFTSTSAVCVTGLVVRDTGTEFSRFGQWIILFLIQMGGLGFMTAGTLIFMLLRKRITLKERLLIRESMNSDTLTGMVRLMRWVLMMTLCVELSGALLLSIRFVPIFGLEEGAFRSLFHAVSAFCNAGFDVNGNYLSMTEFASDPMVLLPLILLITTGGLGFAVLMDIWHHRRFGKLEIHARLVLAVTGILTLSGFVLVLLTEWNNPNTLGPMNFGDKLLNALFQSVTFRTAGFNSIDQAAMHPATKFIGCILMFIGAAPASTGGGIKLTTISVLALMVLATARGRSETTVMRHTVPRSLLQRAMTVLLIAMAVVLTDAVLLSLVEEGYDFLDVLFETISAFGTVGLSSGVTRSLHHTGRALLILTMFIGRVGPLTLALALARKQSQTSDPIRYPDARIMIG